jgi:hypothetical protein
MRATSHLLHMMIILVITKSTRYEATNACFLLLLLLPLMGANGVPFSTSFSDNFNICRSFSSTPNHTKDNVTVLHTLIFRFLGRRREDKIFVIETYRAFLELYLSLI